MQHVYATQTVQMENGSTIKCESYAWLRHSSQTVLAQSRRFLILERIINSILFNAQQIKTKSKMKSIIFFVATIATVLAAPYYPALQVYSNGAVAPVETPEVQHEKAKHFAAHAERSHGYGPVHVAAYAAPHAYGYHVPVIHNGVPVDTPEVQHAKAAHFAAYAKAAHGLPVHAHTYAAGHYHVPVIHNGTPN